MEFELLKTMVEKRNKSLDLDYVRPKHYDFINDSVNVSKDVDSILVSHLLVNTNLPKEKCEEIVESLNLESGMSYSEFQLLVDFLLYLSNNNLLEEAKDFLTSKGLIGEIKGYKKTSLDKIDSETLMFVKQSLSKNKMSILPFIELLETNREQFVSLSNIVEDYKEKHQRTMLSIIKEALVLTLRDVADNRYSNQAKVYPEKLSYQEAVYRLKKYIEKIDLEEKNHYKQTKLEKYHNELMLTNLEKELQKKEITNIRPLIKRIVDEQIKEMILIVIYKHNLAYMKSLDKEYNTLMENSTTRYKSLLNEFEIEIDEDNLDLITHNNIEDLREILTSLRSISVSINLYLSILSITNLSTVSDIKDLVNKGYLSKLILENNIDIFNSNNKLLNIVKTNVDLINNFQLNPSMFSACDNIILLDSNLLEKNLRIIETYNLTKSLKSTTKFNFLSLSNLAELIDKYLELGYESILEEDLQVLNYTDTRRLEILHNMGFTLEKDELIEMYEYNKFFIPDECLDDYIPNIEVDTACDTITLDELLEYKSTSRTLSINNHLISLNKVLRVHEETNSTKKAIYHNMNVDLSTYEDIETTLKSKQYSI